MSKTSRLLKFVLAALIAAMAGYGAVMFLGKHGAYGQTVVPVCSEWVCYTDYFGVTRCRCR